jgi:HEAT repeat protein
MDVYRPNLPGQDYDVCLDPLLQPMPDCSSLGPDSALASKLVLDDRPDRKQLSTLRLLHVAVMMAGIGLAVTVSTSGVIGTLGEKFSRSFSSPKNPDDYSALSSDRDLDRQKPQRQAEILLERAVARTDGATNQIDARVDAWRGNLKWDAQLGELTTAALNSSDRNVRDSAIEVQLAAYGLSKSHATVNALIQQVASADHSKKIWALWSLGLLANRGIETDRVVAVLTTHLKDTDHLADNNSEDSRRWAVESLALVGTTPAIAPLLDAMHNDPSALVRERAACSLAESGMFSHDQRLLAIPQLINYSDDPALDAQTRSWAFVALADITQQRLPNNSAAWRNWYQTAVASGQ